MAVRNYVRDSRGRFAPRGGGVISGPKAERPQPRGGSITRALRRGQRDLYRAEQSRIQSLGGNVAGMRLIRGAIRRGAAARTAAAPAAGGTRSTGRVSDALRGTLRQLAQSDARYYRELGTILGSTGGASKRVSGSRGKSTKRLKGS